MTKLSKVLVSLLSLTSGVAQADQNILFDALTKARNCTVATYSKTNQIDCKYELPDFYLTIAGVGQEDAAIGFMNSNFDGMYWGSVGRLHGCAIIKVGRNHPQRLKHEHVKPAFISPVNGVVYDDWQLCAIASRK